MIYKTKYNQDGSYTDHNRNELSVIFDQNRALRRFFDDHYIPWIVAIANMADQFKYIIYEFKVSMDIDRCRYRFTVQLNFELVFQLKCSLHQKVKTKVFIRKQG